MSLMLCIGIFFTASAQFSDIKTVTEQELNVPRFVVTGDMNNDGREDIIVPSHRSIFINYNLPNEDFSTFIEPVINLGAPQTVYVCDLNGNGFLDILGTDFDVANENFWVPNNGDGTFGDKITIYTGARPYHIFAADIDGDGDNDVLTNSAAEAELRLFKILMA